MPKSSLTVYFESPFWVGVYERTENGYLSVCKITFGAEPKDYEVYAFLLAGWHLLEFSPPVEAAVKPLACANPKRRQRVIARQMRKQGVGTKAQQAVSQARQEGKKARRKKSRAQKEQEQQRQFDLRTQKRKDKHKGR